MKPLTKEYINGELRWESFLDTFGDVIYIDALSGTKHCSNLGREMYLDHLEVLKEGVESFTWVVLDEDDFEGNV